MANIAAITIDPKFNSQEFDDEFFNFNPKTGESDQQIILDFYVRLNNLPKVSASYKVYLQRDNFPIENIINEQIDISTVTILDKYTIALNSKYTGFYKIYILFESDGEKRTSSVISFIINTHYENTGNILTKKITDQFSYNFPMFQTHLFKDGKNEVLFEFSKPSFHDPNLPDENQYQPKNIILYRTDSELKKIDDIINTKNIYKIINFETNGYSFIDKIDINKTYYYAARADVPEANAIKLILFLIFLVTTADIDEATQLSNDSFKKYTEIQTPAISIKVLKDENFYFLEKSIIDFDKLIDKKQGQKFSNKIFIQPKFNLNNSNGTYFPNTPFQLGEPVFNSETNIGSYIKFRITSKKTHRKVDVNLKYTYSPAIKVMTEKELDDKGAEKYTESSPGKITTEKELKNSVIEKLFS